MMNDCISLTALFTLYYAVTIYAHFRYSLFSLIDIRKIGIADSVAKPLSEREVSELIGSNILLVHW